MFDDTLTKKAALNALAAALDYGARLIVGFLVTPWLVAGLGNYFYGTWQILNRMIGYISPASGRAVRFQAAGVLLTSRNLDEGIRWRRGLTVIVISPARDRAVRFHAAGVASASGDPGERVFRGRGLVGSPARYCAVRFHTAAEKLRSAASAVGNMVELTVRG